MSDAEVLRLIAEMEGLLAKSSEDLDSESIAAWHRMFQEAVAGAERGPGWPTIVSRAQAVANAVDQRVGALSREKDALRQEMEAQSAGQRALKAYKPPVF